MSQLVAKNIGVSIVVPQQLRGYVHQQYFKGIVEPCLEARLSKNSSMHSNLGITCNSVFLVRLALDQRVPLPFFYAFYMRRRMLRWNHEALIRWVIEVLAYDMDSVL